MPILDLLKTTKKSPSATIEKAIAAGREQRAALEADRARAADARVAAVRAGDTKGKAKAATDVAAIDDKIGDLDILLADREADLVAARETERDRTIADAKRLADTAQAESVKALTTDGPVARDALLNIIASFAKAEIARDRYEALRRPETAAMPRVELTLRGRPGSERRILSERTVQRWCYSGTGHVIPEDAVSRVQKRSGRTGFLPAGDWSTSVKPVELRTFRELRIVPEVRAEWLAPLAETLRLPPLKAGEPALWEPLSGSVRPEDVLDAIERRRAAASAAPAEPKVEIELIPVDSDNETVAA